MKRSFGLGLLLSLQVTAGDLRAPFDWESSATLPQGVRNPRLKALFATTSERFGSAGQVEPLGGRLNKSVGWSEVLASAPDPKLTEAVLLTQGLDAENSPGPGRTLGEVRVQARAWVPVMAMGLTDRLTLAWAVPVMSVAVSANTGFELSDEGERFLNGVNAMNHYQAAELADKLSAATNNKLERLGYDPIHSEQFTRLGDMRLVGKYRLDGGDAWAWALKGELTLPSGTPPNVHRLVDVPTGDGQADLGLAAVTDGRFPNPRWRWNTYLGFTYQMGDSLERRIPLLAGDPLSADLENLQRKLGNIWAMGAGLAYWHEPWDMSLGTAYHAQFLGGTHYRPGVYAPERYRLLEAESPAQRLTSWSLFVQYSSVERYQKKQAQVPFQVQVSYNPSLSGRNVPNTQLVAAEWVLFF